jgi:hypothetical protein
MVSAGTAAGCQQAATALGAVFQFFVRDILGMAGGIIFAYAAGALHHCSGSCSV